MYYEIDENLAKQSKHMKSFDDYKANSTTNEYRQHISEVTELAEELKTKAKYEETKNKIDYCVNAYSKKYAGWVNKLNRIDCMCPSWFVSGSSNYPMKKFEKQHEMYANHMKEYSEFKDIEYKLKSILSGENIISVSDKNAIEKLQEKIERLQENQVKMKEENIYYRKHKTMKGFKNLTDEEAQAIDQRISNNYSWQKCPFPSYSLSNNSQEIRRLKNRLESLKKAKENPTTEIKNKYFNIVKNTECMKLQLFFKGKPIKEVRNIVKNEGFRWSPMEKCWQRKLTSNARYSLKIIIQNIEKLNVEITENN